MAAASTQDDAIRQRIIRHMNADHQDSVRRYLEAYNNKSVFQSRDARMTDISLNEMKFDCSGQQHTITFDPPMKSLSEARERVVQLDKEALQILVCSDIAIDKYIPPTVKLGHLYNFTQCFLSYLLLPSASNWQPGSILYDNLLYRVPNFAGFVAQFGWWIVFAFMVPIHLAEAGIMGRRLRKKHGLTPLDGIWWAWTASCFVEGFTAMWRLSSLVEQKRKEKDSKKH
ncbi:hypothetical protein BKA63DRAFT_413153 [Paraphoma chrysanthemicola]|nr:hypothetical protein BKA63DRAFT_413153 [Paraphoma chrysanthemicola]